MTPTVAARPSTGVRIVRFDAVQRAAHWINALLFGILMATALPLYFGSIAGVVGRRALVEQIHLWAGIALPVPLLISILGPWGTRFRRDLRRINVWSRDEVTWLKALGRRAPQVVDKFNPGQKLNATLHRSRHRGDARHRCPSEVVPVLPPRMADRGHIRP